MPTAFCASAVSLNKQKVSKISNRIILSVAFTYQKDTKLVPLTKKNSLL
jgi:hypothetical protein